jgi:hypothetical protein
VDHKKMMGNVQKSTKGKVSEKDVMKLAGQVNTAAAMNEQYLRKLIMQVSGMAKVPVSEATIQQIIRSVKQSGLDPNNLEQLIRTIQGR